MAFTISGLTGLIFPDGTLQPSSGATTVGALRAWVNFNGTGTVAIRASGNVSSITDNGTGEYTVNFSTAMPDSNYAFAVNGTYSNWYTCFFGTNNGTGITASSLSIGVSDAYNGFGWRDVDRVVVTIFR